MDQQVETVIVGAGQAGLALSRRLRDLDREHVLLERGEVAQRWRAERWDSFSLLTPSWHTRLPGHRYTGDDPDGFLAKGEVVDMFEQYAASFAAPVETGVTVEAATPLDDGTWRVATDRGTWSARNVVVATGHCDRPNIPAVASALSPEVEQLPVTRYRNPAALPDGGVLVVGSASSGQQVARELAGAGRAVFLASGSHPRLPRTYRGRDVIWWMDRMGKLDETVDEVPDLAAAKRAPSLVLSGADGAHDLSLPALAAEGVHVVGRLVGVDGARATFADDVAATIEAADRRHDRFTAAVDEFVARTGIPADVAEPRPQSVVPDAPTEMHLQHAGISTVIWATGFHRDFRWVHAPVFDAAGEPLQRRGVTVEAGLFFLGLRWMHRRKSSFIDGVGDDATWLAQHLDCRARESFGADRLVA